LKIAPDVEKLMWAVAESADARAVADFESRFPDLRYELSKRIDMVRELKSSRKLGESEGRTPRFVMRKETRPLASPVRYVLAFTALSALAAGSFFVARPYFSSATPKLPPVETVRTAPLEPAPIQYGSAPSGPPKAVLPDSNLQQANPTVPDAPWDRPQNVKFERIRLLDALNAIALQSGLQLEIAPGMPNPLIQANYSGISGLAILADMGPQFGFTAFEQGEGKVIVIPARDPRQNEPIDGSGATPKIESDRSMPEVDRSER
jgi:hypothetical protein